MGSHALLSASSSHRWISCPPSARLCENRDDQSSEYAQQGTDAHSLCQYKVESALEMDTADPTDSLNFYDEEMENCAESYAAYVMEQRAKALENCIDPVVLVEQRLDFSKYLPEGFGTGDCVIIADGTLSVIDYKHGKGILVKAEKNPQMLCYALGALELFDGIYDIDIVSMTIFQPRRENVSTYTVTKAELLQWAEEILIPRAKLAYAGEGDFTAGEHCQFCKVKPPAGNERNTTWNLPVMISRCLPLWRMKKSKPFLPKQMIWPHGSVISRSSLFNPQSAVRNGEAGNWSRVVPIVNTRMRVLWQMP